ncbi:hypothetical protein GFS60_07205 (plasmid) [Rhodococcus sp. WAY2]|nr:hypothetical protein GFS60_07205 [Rhodococcus sp. WAY2]
MYSSGCRLRVIQWKGCSAEPTRVQPGAKCDPRPGRMVAPSGRPVTTLMSCFERRQSLGGRGLDPLPDPDATCKFRSRRDATAAGEASRHEIALASFVNNLSPQFLRVPAPTSRSNRPLQHRRERATVPAMTITAVIDVASAAYTVAEGLAEVTTPDDRVTGCARCGRHTVVMTPVGQVVSRRFTGYESWTNLACRYLCAVCVWVYRHRPLRTDAHIVTRDPVTLRPANPALLHQVLSTTIDADTAVIVPLRPGRKHLFPDARWGQVTVDFTDRRYIRTRRSSCATFGMSRGCLPTRVRDVRHVQTETRRACGDASGGRGPPGSADRPAKWEAVVDDRLAGGNGASRGGPVPARARRVGHPTDLFLLVGGSPALARARVPGVGQSGAAGSRAVHGHRRRRGGDAVGRAVAGRETPVRACGAVDHGSLSEGLLSASGGARGERRARSETG